MVSVRYCEVRREYITYILESYQNSSPYNEYLEIVYGLGHKVSLYIFYSFVTLSASINIHRNNQNKWRPREMLGRGGEKIHFSQKLFKFI